MQPDTTVNLEFIICHTNWSICEPWAKEHIHQPMINSQHIRTKQRTTINLHYANFFTLTLFSFDEPFLSLKHKHFKHQKHHGMAPQC